MTGATVKPGNWFDGVFPWEQPPWWRPIRRKLWRKRHERIRRLEFLNNDSRNWRDLPWDTYGY